MTLTIVCFNSPGCRTDGDARTFGSGTHIFPFPALCKFIVAHFSCHNRARIEILVVQSYDSVIMDKLN